MFQLLSGGHLRNARRSTKVAALAILLSTTLPPLAAGSNGTASASLTLALAVERTLARNPELQVYRLRDAEVQGRMTTAALSPLYELGAEAENFAGTGDLNSADGAEFTLALSSVIELGGKRAARMAEASAERQLLDGERQARALDLIGEVTRRYVDVAASQARLDLAVKARALAVDAQQAVERRVQAGAAPEAERFRATAQKTQAELAVSEAQHQLRSACQSLAVLWGQAEPDFVQVAGDLQHLGAVGDFTALYERAQRNPAIALFASEERLREAQLQLARTQSSADVGWSVGVRQFQDTDDTALVAGVNMPLFSAARNAGALRSAQAARDAVAVERDAALLELRATLFDAFQQRKLGMETAGRLQAEVIPALTRALQLTQAAYEHGRYSYQEWVAARQELIAAQSELITAQAAALQNGATIEQLTAEPLLPPLAADAGSPAQESAQ